MVHPASFFFYAPRVHWNLIQQPRRRRGLHPSMSDYGTRSLELHRALGGKLEVRSKAPLETREDLSLAYTPGVGQVSIEIGQHPEAVWEYTIKKNTVAVVSDGSAILGLGNLGAAAAIPVMEGKAALFKRFANIDAFPICLNTQDTEEIIKIVQSIAPVFGGINLEDIAAPRCFEIERRLADLLDIPVVHDDQQGTAVVVLAALTNALKVRQMTLSDVRVVVNGAGAAGTAVSRLLHQAGVKQLVVCDSHGIVSMKRTDLNNEKRDLASLTNLEGRTGGLLEALTGANVFIGVSKAGVLSQDLVRLMAAEPVIFAMANPLPEIMPDEALAAGASIVATGRSDFANQINNVLAFPGIFRGALDNRVRRVTSTMLHNAALALAACVSTPTAEKIVPSPFDPGVMESVASAMHE